MKICSEKMPIKTVNWRYRLTDSVIDHVSELPTKNLVPVMNWRYRLPDLSYEILATVKSTSEVNWRYKIPGISPSDLN
jgi:hypothetical protein